MLEALPHINASLNGLATLLLAVGFVMIKARNERAHKLAMMSAFVVSGVFLVCYLIYHANVGSKLFPATAYPTAAYVYYPLLASHVILAMGVPVLSVWAIVMGWLDRREAHRAVVKWAFPIWFYVSITGVLVYLMLYWWFPAPLETGSEAVARMGSWEIFS